MKYLYQARTKEGKIETGTVEASSKEAAAVLLQKYDVFVTSLKEADIEEKYIKKLTFERKVNKKDLAIFSRQLSVMLEARVPVVQSLTSLAVQTHKTNFREAILKISELVEEGSPLSDAFGKFPNIFNNFYVSLVKSGEASGKISSTLQYLSDHLEKEDDLANQIKGVLVYPIFTICVLFGVITLVVIVLVPRLKDLLRETSTNPPPLTVFMINFYDFAGKYGWIVLAGIFLLAVGAVYYFLKTPKGRINFDILSLKIPFIGEILKKASLARFAENISTLIGAGISINRALEITAKTVNNHVYQDLVFEMANEISQGEKMSSVMVKHQQYFPAFVVQMVKVGEETGKIEKTLQEIVNFYQKEVERAVAVFQALLEPVLIVVIGIIVCMLAISVLGPLYGALGTI